MDVTSCGWIYSLIASSVTLRSENPHHAIPSYIYLLYPAWWEHLQVLRYSPVNFLAVEPQRLLQPLCYTRVPSYHNSLPLLLHGDLFKELKKKKGRVCSPHMNCPILVIMSIRLLPHSRGNLECHCKTSFHDVHGTQGAALHKWPSWSYHIHGISGQPQISFPEWTPGDTSAPVDHPWNTSEAFSKIRHGAARLRKPRLHA